VNLPLHIAVRYLFSKKKHNAVNIVSMVSVFGVATAVAALVSVLSVYNGFQELLGSVFSRFDPTIKILVNEGKTFTTEDKTFLDLRKDPRVAVFCETIEENALVQYKNAQTSAIIKGVSDSFGRLTQMNELMVSGNFQLKDQNFNYAVIGVGLADVLGTGGSFIDPITIIAPKRVGAINMVNPSNSFTTMDVLLSGSFSINQADYDNGLVIVPLSLARELFEYTNEVTGVELKLKNEVDADRFAKELSSKLSSKFNVLTLKEQKADVYRINRIEKWMTYLILSFILLLALFNVIGTLSMLILEKQDDAETLSRLGARQSTIRRIFQSEGWLVAFFGAMLGLILGTILCFLQQHYGLLKLGGGGRYVIDAYPVRLQIKDLLIVFITVLVISIPTTWWPVQAYLRKKEKS
jgi:lipoprotein-releasing system permease protein